MSGSLTVTKGIALTAVILGAVLLNTEGETARGAEHAVGGAATGGM